MTTVTKLPKMKKNVLYFNHLHLQHKNNTLHKNSYHRGKQIHYSGTIEFRPEFGGCGGDVVGVPS